MPSWSVPSADLRLVPGVLRAPPVGRPRAPTSETAIAATADNGMVELETILTPVSFNGGEPRRFFGLVQMLSDPTPLLGRAIAYERLIASQLIQKTNRFPIMTRICLRLRPRAGCCHR